MKVWVDAWHDCAQGALNGIYKNGIRFKMEREYIRRFLVRPKEEIDPNVREKRMAEIKEVTGTDWPGERKDEAVKWFSDD